jgi:integrase
MVVLALKEWKLACPQSELDLVFPGQGGKPMALVTIVGHAWHPAQITACVTNSDGSAKYSGFHALRHFYASWCINRKQDGGLELPLKVVQTRLGHASIQMTANVYGHLFPQTDASAEMQAAERMFLSSV